MASLPSLTGVSPLVFSALPLESPPPVSFFIISENRAGRLRIPPAQPVVMIETAGTGGGAGSQIQPFAIPGKTGAEKPEKAEAKKHLEPPVQIGVARYRFA